MLDLTCQVLLKEEGGKKLFQLVEGSPMSPEIVQLLTKSVVFIKTARKDTPRMHVLDLLSSFLPSVSNVAWEIPSDRSALKMNLYSLTMEVLGLGSTSFPGFSKRDEVKLVGKGDPASISFFDTMNASPLSQTGPFLAAPLDKVNTSLDASSVNADNRRRTELSMLIKVK